MTRHLIQAFIIAAALPVGSSVHAGPIEFPPIEITQIGFPPSLPPMPDLGVTQSVDWRVPKIDVGIDSAAHVEPPVATGTVETPRPAEAQARPSAPEHRRSRLVVAHPELSGLLRDLRADW
jgi:hypothetical protein